MAWKGTGRGQAGDTSWLGKNGVGWGGCHATPGQGDLSHLLGPRRSEAPALGMEPSWGSGLHNSRGHQHSQSATEGAGAYGRKGRRAERGPCETRRCCTDDAQQPGQSARGWRKAGLESHLHLHPIHAVIYFLGILAPLFF